MNCSKFCRNADTYHKLYNQKNIVTFIYNNHVKFLDEIELHFGAQNNNDYWHLQVRVQGIRMYSIPLIKMVGF